MLLRPIAVATAIIFVALAVWHLGGRPPSLVVSYSTVDNDTLSTISGRDSDDIVVTLPPSTSEPTPAPTTPAPLPLCESSVRVYEVFLFNKEIDMLEIRVAELFDVVDWFILCESTVNFQGGSKPLHFETLKHQLPARFLTKIKHHVCDIRRVEPHEDKWTRETLHHECMRSALIQHGMKHGDLAHLLDVDEIPFARSIANERRRVTNALCSDDTKDLPVDSNDPKMVAKRHHLEHQYPVRMNMPLFYMHLRNLHHIPWWTELHFSNNGNVGSMKRRTHTRRMEDSGGIHCSWCFRTVSDYQTKYKSYSHTEHNTEKSRDAALIRNCYCTNKFLRAHLNENTPHATIYSREDAIARFATSYMKQNLTKYAFLFPEQGPDCTLPD